MSEINDLSILNEALSAYYMYGNNGANSVFASHDYQPSETEQRLLSFAIQKNYTRIYDKMIKSFMINNRMMIMNNRHIEMMNDGSLNSRITMQKIMKEDVVILLPIYDQLYDENGDLITRTELEELAKKQRESNE